MPTPTSVLFLNGSYGVGKSSVLDHLGDVLAEHDRPFSLLDVDWFHRSWPPADDDPENVRTEAANLAAVWQNYRRTGARQPVVAGVLTSELDRQRYARVFDLPVRSVRLVAPAAVVEARLRGRYPQHRDRALDWHLRRHLDLGQRQALADLDELVVDTERLVPRAVAEQVARHFGLLAAA